MQVQHTRGKHPCVCRRQIIFDNVSQIALFVSARILPNRFGETDSSIKPRSLLSVGFIYVNSNSVIIVLVFRGFCFEAKAYTSY
jgi:hypothetical protein